MVGIIFLTAYPVAIVLLFTFVEKEQVIELLTGMCIFILSYLGLLFALWLSGELLALNNSVQYKVLLVNREEEVHLEKKAWVIAAWAGFVNTVALTVCYYAFRYESAGTYKPRWADIFR